MTPYPHSDQHLENPSILRSDDGMTLSVPAGLTNPVVKAPPKSPDYNSDPELLYEAQSGRLVLFHRFVEKKTNTLHMSTSRDGVTWTSAQGAVLGARAQRGFADDRAPLRRCRADVVRRRRHERLRRNDDVRRDARGRRPDRWVRRHQVGRQDRHELEHSWI